MYVFMFVVHPFFGKWTEDYSFPNLFNFGEIMGPSPLPTNTEVDPSMLANQTLYSWNSVVTQKHSDVEGNWTAVV